MARKINKREIYVLSIRRLLTWKAHSAYQTKPAAKLAEQMLVDLDEASAYNIKIEQVTLNV